MTRPALELSLDFDSDLAIFTDTAGSREGITVSRGNTSLITTGAVADYGHAETDLDNIDRSLDPNYTSGPYGGGADLVPGVGAILRAEWDSVDYDVLTGTVDGFPQDFPLTGADQVVHLKVTDGTALFENGSLYIQRNGEFTGARINALADALGWDGPRAIAHGNAHVSPLMLGSVSAWSHATDVAEAEWGELYFAKDGTLTFRSRDQILSDDRSMNSQATFVQNPADGLNYSGVTLTSPPIVNDCTITFNDSGDEVNAQDADSIDSKWKVRSLPISLPLHNRSQAQQYANWVVARYKTPLTTFLSIALTPSNEPGATYDLWAQALGRELGDLITVILDPRIDAAGTLSGEPIERECWIRGIQHNITDAEWSTTFTLQDASWRAGLARWDVSVWDGSDVWGL